MYAHLRLAFLLVVVGAVGCQCDPPGGGAPDGGEGGRDVSSPLLDAGQLADAGDDDAGGEDAGDVDAGDAGEEGFTLTGEVWVQREDGALVRLDLATGESEEILGGPMASSALAADGDDLITYTPTMPDGSLEGRLLRFSPATGETTLLARAPRPWSLATDGTTAGVAPELGNILWTGALTDDALESTGVLAQSVALDGDGLVVSSEQGTSPLSGVAFSSRSCGGLAWVAERDAFLCGLTDGTQLLEIARDGGETVLFPDAGFPYRSALSTEEGYIAVRGDTEVVSDVSLPAAVTEVFPAQLAEAGGSLFVAGAEGGLFEVDADGVTWARLPFTRFGEGLAVANGRVALAGTPAGYVGWMNEDLSEPRLSAAYFEMVFGLALEDDGTLWVADEDGIYRIPAGSREPALVHELSDITDFVRDGDGALVARGEDGLFRMSFADPENLIEQSTRWAARVAACDGAAVFLHPAGNTLFSLDALGEERFETTELMDEVGDVVGLGCLGDQVLLGTPDGTIFGRPLGSTLPWAEAATLPASGLYFSPAPVD